MRVMIGSVLGSLFLVSTVVGQYRSSGIDPQGIDRSVRVQDDLFLHINGQWLKHTPIPPDKSAYGSFSILFDAAQINIRNLINDAAEGAHAPGSDARKVGDFFTSYMDESTVELRGLEPLVEELQKIDRLTTKQDVFVHLGHLLQIGVDSPVGFYVDQDDKDSSRYLTAIVQSGTTLPDRDYYLQDDPKYLKAREALVAYVRQLFQLSSLPDGIQAAGEILELETELARVQWERTELRNANKRYNLYQVAELPELTPGLPWESFFDAAGVGGVADVNVMTPSFFEGLDEIFDQTPLEVWKRYLQFRLIDAYATVLPKPFVDASFTLHQQELGGVLEQQPRWKRAVNATAGTRGFGVLGDSVGRLYVAKYYPEEAKRRMDELVANLMSAYRDSVADLTWMSPATKERAQEKLSKITTKIGHTDKWRDYSRLVIKPDDLLGNMLRSAQVEHRRMTDKLGQPVDRAEWHMTPQTINAYYNPGMNEIVFPAAILQPPFFDVEADDAANYGGIGSIIGHEISHAFDDQGSKYDGDGNLNDWWTDEDRAAFKKLTSLLVKQYNAYSPLPEKRVDGELTLGENIADLSGMSIAYKAYALVLDGEEAPVLDGWTGPQRFFLGWGQSWRRKYRDAEMIRRLLTDPHAPAKYRSNGPLTNFDPFYEAFNIRPGDQLYQPTSERIRIW